MDWINYFALSVMIFAVGMTVHTFVKIANDAMKLKDNK